MDYCATLTSLKKLGKNQYEARFTCNENEYTKRFEVAEGNGHDEILIDDRDLEPRLTLSNTTKRALFAFHRSFSEPNPVEKRSLMYLSLLYSHENLARIEKEKLNLLEQTLERLSPEEQRRFKEISRERAVTDEKYGKKILADPDTDILHRPLG